MQDLRERRELASPEELAAFETDVLAGFVLARTSRGTTNSSAQAKQVIALPVGERNVPERPICGY